MDLTDPTSPTLAGQIPIDGYVDTVAVGDGLVYAVLPDRGLEVIEVGSTVAVEPPEYKLAQLSSADSWSATQ